MEKVVWSGEFSLEAADFTGYVVNGVYIIWHRGNPGRVVRIGQGDVASRLSSHRKDAAILAYRASGDLYAKCAAVPTHLRDGVERYLAEKWLPLVGDRFPDVSPIAVNDPW
ncbi:MAG: hypothetical protein ABUL43_02300 [Hyphomicrobium sp.]